MDALFRVIKDKNLLFVTKQDGMLHPPPFFFLLLPLPLYFSNDFSPTNLQHSKAGWLWSKGRVEWGLQQMLSEGRHGRSWDCRQLRTSCGNSQLLERDLQELLGCPLPLGNRARLTPGSLDIQRHQHRFGL